MNYLLLFACFSIVAAQSNDYSIGSILPVPQKVTAASGQFKISSATKIVIGRNTPQMNFIAEQVNEELLELNETQLNVVPEESLRKLTANYIFIGSPSTKYGKQLLKQRNGTLTPEMKTEGYFLDVNRNGVAVIAESEKGMLYGVMSLLQIIHAEKRTLAVPGGTILDYPAQKVRGITDDISRGQTSTPDNFKKIIRFLARYKMNVYSPYIEDIFQFKNHPDIGKNRGALTHKEWREIDAYAKKYGVEIIPIFETLGHWENILLDPKYSGFGEFTGAQTINVSDEKALALLDGMIGEVASCFSSPYFNIAADESWDVGLGANKERVMKSDIATVHAEHYKRVFAMVKKYGKIPLMYGDVVLDHPEILTKIPKDVTFVDWHYGTAFDYPSPEIFKTAGFQYIVSPAVWNFTGPFPNYLNTFMNIQYLTQEGFRNGSLGVLCSNWNDFGGEALRELNYYGYAWTAECAWNPMNVDRTSFDEKFFTDFYRVSETEKIQTVYAILSDPANQYHWYELWRHPMLPNRDNMIWEVRLPLMQRMQSIRSTMPFVLRLLGELKEDVKRNNSQLADLEFAARMNLWFADKIEAQEKIKLLVKQKDSTTVPSELASKITALSDGVVTGLGEVRSEFQKVWKMTNAPEGLDRLLLRYDRQTAYWNEVKQKALAGDFDFNPELKSQWIYHPKADPNGTDTMKAPHVYFRRTLNIAGNVRDGKIQLLGDTWAKLFVNGKFAGEVYARRSLSLIVESERAKIFDVTPLLHDSVNTIAVEAQNFQEKGSAGMNVYGMIETTDGKSVEITSDSSWSVSEVPSVGWNDNSSGGSPWVQAFPKKYSVPVVAPNISTGRTSWFER